MSGAWLNAASLLDETDACFIVRDINGQAQGQRRSRPECGGPRMPDRCDALPYGAGEDLDKYS